MLPSSQAAFRIMLAREEGVPTFAFGHQQVYYVATRFVDQLRIEDKDFNGREDTWRKVRNFLDQHRGRTVIGYIGYETVHQNRDIDYGSTFPIAHLLVPVDVERFDTSTTREEILFPHIELSKYDNDPENKENYLRAVQKVLCWIGEHKKRKLTIARKVPLPPIDLWKSFQQDPTDEYRHFSFYYGVGDMEFAGRSPEMTLYRSPNLDVLVCEKASGTFPQGNSEQFEKDPKNVHEHQLSIDSLTGKLRDVARIDGISREIRDFPHLQHFVTSFRLKPKKTPLEVMEVLFPKGAEPVEGIELVRKLEGFSRGPYYGLFFAQLSDGELQVYHILRSLFREGDHHYTICGAGITGNSDPNGELQETELKLSSIIARK